MNFCAVICEYNPFHNGHAYQLKTIKEKKEFDGILCLMSGNFTQRGEGAIFSKYERARHAVENGADVVLELPALFSVAPAEIFARGAVKILASVPAVKALAFGCESGTKEDFLRAGRALLDEGKEFKATLKENMKQGDSYKVAKTKTVLALNADVDEATLTAPNNLLGVQYVSSILAEKSNIEPLPIERVGSGYADCTPKKNFSSASALRQCIRAVEKRNRKILKSNLPTSVYPRAAEYSPAPFEVAFLSALARADAEELALCPDCTEGLENRLLSLFKSNPSYAELLNKIANKRYTLSRLKRILAQNLLKITRKAVKEALESPLYYKVLAVKKDGGFLEALSEGAFPLITRRSDAVNLKGAALDCFLTDVRGVDVYGAITGKRDNEYETLFL